MIVQKTYEQMTIQELVEQAKMQDAYAFAQLYQRYAPSIYYYALKLSHNDADAHDIVQDTFIQAQRSITALKNPDLFKVWLNRIAFSKATKLFSRNRTISFDPEDPLYCEQISESKREWIPHDQMHFQNDKELLDHFIVQLPLEQKTVLILMYYEHFSLQEIAQIMEIPIGTVKSRIHMAKHKLNHMIHIYEKRNEVKLTFHGDTLAASLGVLGIRHALRFHLSRMFHYVRGCCSVSHTIGGVVATACVGMVIIGGVYQNKTQEPPITETSLEQTAHPFPTLVYQDRIFNRADDVYYALLQFAHCDVAMDTKTQEEMDEIRILYEGLKSYGSIYYERLVEDNWASAYESRVYQ